MANPLARWISDFRRKRDSRRAVRLHYPRFGDLAAFCADEARHRAGRHTLSLDIGCGTTPRNPFAATELFGLDLREAPERNVRHADLVTGPIPFPDATFDYVTAYEFIEHVPRVLYLPAQRFPFVELMNEIHRVLKPGGLFLSHTPAYPYADVFQDPTHVNIITEETFPCYFDADRRWAAMYGFRGAFDVVRQGWSRPRLLTVLRHRPV